MNVLIWEQLGEAERRAQLARPSPPENLDLPRRVTEIRSAVRDGGDAQLIELTKKFDQVDLEAVILSDQEVKAAAATVPDDLKRAIAEAQERIERFHRALIPVPVRIETAAGVICERIYRPIEPVGLYVPAGSAPLPSTALMLGVPARLAGCKEIVLCSPPAANGSIDPAVAHVALSLGIKTVCPLGGVQAIAAMAYGSESIPACNKIYGPGNAWVTEAKLQVATDPQGALIDLPAGPSEVLVIADAGARADFVAADLLSQAEHGPDSQVILLTPSAAMAVRVLDAIETQLPTLSRAAIARQALEQARLIVTGSLDEAVQISNRYAPEHLILQLAEPRTLLPEISSAGSIFLGQWAPESIGDYCSGTNHVLPTNGYARATGGLGVESFMKAMTVQELTVEGLDSIGETAEILARAEGLTAHERAVSIRREAISAGVTL